MPANGFFSIGEISKMTDISEKRLRSYDAQGLCSPEFIDPDNSYRYYSIQQIPRLKWIDQLRTMDVPVNVIRDTISANDVSTIKKVLDEQVFRNREKLTQMQYQYEQTLEYRTTFYKALEQLKNFETAPRISTLNTELCYFLTEKADFAFDDLGDEQRHMLFIKINRIARNMRLVVMGSEMLQITNHPMLTGGDKSLVPEVSVVVQIPSYSGVPINNLELHPSFACVTAVHVGPYEKLPQTYETILRYCEERNIKLKANSTEEYRVTKAMVTDPSKLVTQIYIHLAD